MKMILLLLLVGVLNLSNGSPTTTDPPMVNYNATDDPTTEPAMVNLDEEEEEYKDPIVIELPNNDGDGNSTLEGDDDQDRIIGGFFASTGQFPIMARLFLNFENGQKLQVKRKHKLMHNQQSSNLT